MVNSMHNRESGCNSLTANDYIYCDESAEGASLCLTAGKPQSGVACVKSAAINMCLEVAQHCSTSSTPIYCVGLASPQVSLRYTSG